MPPRSKTSLLFKTGGRKEIFGLVVSIIVLISWVVTSVAMFAYQARELRVGRLQEWNTQDWVLNVVGAVFIGFFLAGIGAIGVLFVLGLLALFVQWLVHTWLT
jgi:hypothetical protein